MLDLKHVSASHAAQLARLDTADKTQDNRIRLSQLSQADKTALRDTLNEVVKEDGKTLNAEDKASINALLISLNSTGQTGKGAAWLDLTHNVSFPDKAITPPKTAEVKPVTSLRQETPPSPAEAWEAEKSAPALRRAGEAFKQPAKAAAEPGLALEKLKQQSELGERFHKGGMIYSQNFGLLDSHHIQHLSLSFLQVYNAAVKSQQTGEAQEIKLRCGSGSHEYDFSYKIKAEPGADLIKIAREVAAHASYRYEVESKWLGGDLNKAAAAAGRGTSAFSTEDLPSNALGIHAAERYLRCLLKDPNHPDPAVAAELAKVTAPPKTNEAGAAIAKEAREWVLSHAGQLYPADDSTLKPKTLDTMDFKPKTVRNDTVTVEPESSEAAFFDDFKNLDLSDKATGTGWGFTDKNWIWVDW